MRDILLILLVFFNNLLAQDKKSKDIKVEVSAGTAGGSFYDIPSGYSEFDK